MQAFHGRRLLMLSCPRCQRTFDDGVKFCPVDGAQVRPAQADRNLGRTLGGQFDLREVCGRGAMGTVYLAYQHTMDRVVAVKVLRPELMLEPDVVRRFLREARAAAKLQHPNIVTVHLVGETEDGLPFIVMEFVDGVSLEAICEAQGPQPLARVVNLGMQIATALGEAHHAGIVHRDLKPANILVTDRQRVPDQVKVLDFGIAKIVEGKGSEQSVATRDGMIFGTPHYIAPEQATGGDIDRRADLYSLGVILFRLVTGRLPFEGSQGMQVVLKHLREQPPRPRDLVPEMPAALEKLILDLLAKDRALRPPDAEAVLMSLEAIGKGAPAQETMMGMPTGRVPAPAGTRAPAPVRAAPPVERPRPQAQRRVVVGETVTGKIARPNSAPVPVLPRAWWAGRRTLASALVAIGAGASVGVVLAWAHNHVDSRQIAVGPPHGERRVEPSLLEPALFDEHDLKEDGLVLRAGFERAPTAGEASALILALKDAAGPVSNAHIQVWLEPPGDGKGRVIAAAATESGFRAPLAFDAGGAHKLKVLADVPGRRAPLELAFDVDARPGKNAARAARTEPRRARNSEEEMPTVVVPPDPRPSVTPRRLAGPTTPPSSSPSPSPAPTPTPSPTPSVTPTSRIINSPSPARRPRPDPEEPPQDPPSPPPPTDDPTTLPPPAPSDENR